MDEKPLHVQVAEALGWMECRPVVLTVSGQEYTMGRWDGVSPDKNHIGRWEIPHYDTDWSATGPLLERFDIAVGAYNPEFMNGMSWAVWQKNDEQTHLEAKGPTYLVAVCRLILALKEAGKL